MKIIPLSNHILIQPIKEEKTTKTGIIIPDTAEKEHPVKGKVIAVGPGKLTDKGERLPMPVEVGKTVLFKKYGPDEFKFKDESGNEVEYLIAEEDDILAIIEE
jgi:chaperonin GroES